MLFANLEISMLSCRLPPKDLSPNIIFLGALLDRSLVVIYWSTTMSCIIVRRD